MYAMYLGVVGVTPLHNHQAAQPYPNTQLQAHPAAHPDGSQTSLTADVPPLHDTLDYHEDLEARAVCSSLPGLVAQQIEVCLKHPDTIRSVSDGARRGIQECKYQFRNERWNCTTRNDEQNLFGHILERVTSEGRTQIPVFFILTVIDD
ncbi:hypothetical protein J437_LFUL009527 [Ladona fulva]|uniref:Protein Wnt n=1 Tax=Ladona fulva TaxID=123851 RepID=A0A8K0K7U9_LADFU|nr:hypothetical protein J437_LFUL009527 [Ladona fulva]